MKAFYFAYGKTNFGETRDLETNIELELNEIEGCGIALRKHYEYKSFPRKLKLKVTNNSNEELTIRIEKKFNNRVDIQVETLAADSENEFLVPIYHNENYLITEVVVAALATDNKDRSKVNFNLQVK